MVGIRRRLRDRYLRRYEFPEVLRAKVRRAQPDLDAAEVDAVLEELRTWFRSDRRVPPPDRVARAWDEFVLITRTYHAFCDGAFGGYLHRREDGEAQPAGTGRRLAAALGGRPGPWLVLGIKLGLRAARRRVITGYVFPPAVVDRVRIASAFLTDAELELVLNGLRDWFVACLHSDRGRLGMPSRAVDVAWHEFIVETWCYHEFCRLAFGHYLHHEPAAVMNEPMDEPLRRTALLLEQTNARELAPGLPLLFGLDGHLDVEHGFGYSAERVARLRRGEPGAAIVVAVGAGAGCGSDGCGSDGCGSDGCGGCGGCGD